MEHTKPFHNLVLTRHSIHIIPATCISIIIIISTWYLNKILQQAIVKIGDQHQLEATLVKALQKITYILIYSLGLTLFLENLHIHMSSLLGTLGVIAVGIGFALQKALANMTSGMFLLFYKPFFIGDYIISDKPKFEGKITDINLRVTTLEYKGNTVIIPNHTIYSAVVTIKKDHA